MSLAGRVTSLATRIAAELKTKEPLARTVNSQGGSYTLVAADAVRRVAMTSSSANTLTVPPASSVPWVQGNEIPIAQRGTGQTTIAAGSGVTVNSSTGLKIYARYDWVVLIYQGSDVWDLVGRTVS